MLVTRTARVLAAAGAVLAVAAPVAGAAQLSPQTAAGQGQVFEFGRITSISGSTGNDGTTFTKAYTAPGREHVVATQGAGDDGALLWEDATSPRIWKAYTAADDTLTLRDGITSNIVQTPAEEAKGFQQGVAEGCYVKTGSSNGLDHYKMVDQPQLPCSDDPNTKETVDVDQHFGYVIFRDITNGTFEQSESLAYTKVDSGPGAAALLKLAPHPGAKVVDERS